MSVVRNPLINSSVMMGLDHGLTEAQLIEMVNKKLPMYSALGLHAKASSYGVIRKHTYTYESHDASNKKFFLRNLTVKIMCK